MVDVAAQATKRQKPTIMYFDDEPNELKAFKLLSPHKGYEAFTVLVNAEGERGEQIDATAKTVDDIGELLSQVKPAAVVLDSSWPEVTLPEMVQAVRNWEVANNKEEKMPIVIYSGYAQTLELVFDDQEHLLANVECVSKDGIQGQEAMLQSAGVEQKASPSLNG